MSRVVLLEAGPTGLLTNPRAGALYQACSEWLAALVSGGTRVVLPEIADYEVRRELLRIGSTRGIDRLNTLKTVLDYLPITTDVMLRAAEFWALARRRGRPTAANAELDCDVILAAQAGLLSAAGDQPVVATTNVRHLSLFPEARRWQDVP